VRNDLREVLVGVLAGGQLAGSRMIRADAPRRLIQDEQPSHKERAMQIRQLAPLEHWYRDRRSAGLQA